MKYKNNARKQRQLNYLVKRLNRLIKCYKKDIRSDTKDIITRIRKLVKELNGIISPTRIKNILGSVALLIGMTFTNTSSAQHFAYPVLEPFNINPGYTYQIQSVNLVDIDDDGDYDLFTDSMAFFGGYYSYIIINSFNYQENIGTASNPIFGTPNPNSPFGLNILLNDSSDRRYKRFVDLDDDGDYDILENVMHDDGHSAYRYYENAGTPSSASFLAPTINPFGIQPFNNEIVFSFPVDIDNDGDYDLINSIASYGTPPTLGFIENIGTSSNPTFGSMQYNVFGLPSIQSVVIPALTDIDSDGDQDLIFGEYTPYGPAFSYYENIGSSSTANFNNVQTNPFGLSANMFGAIPTLEFKDLDNDGDNDLLAGTEDEVLYFENVLVQQPITYDCINYSCIDPGTGNGAYATISACQTSCSPPVSFDCWGPNLCVDPGDGTGYYLTYIDCMNDCAAPTYDCDPLNGCYDPGNGLGFYNDWFDCQYHCIGTDIETKEIHNTKIFPNPVKDIINISADKEITEISIYDNIGRLVLEKKGPIKVINLEKIDSGIYTMSITFNDTQIVKQFNKY